MTRTLLLIVLALGLVTPTLSRAQTTILDYVDVDGNGVTEFADAFVVYWWATNGGDVPALMPHLVPNEDGLYDLSAFFESDDALISGSIGGSGAAVGSAPSTVSNCTFVRGDADGSGAVSAG